MVTWAPARWARTAAVRPNAPQPITATALGLPAIALLTAIAPEPHDSDQPLPPWP